VPVSPRDTASLGDAGKGSLTLGAAPNPFRPQTTISFQIASPGTRVQLEIFDVTGRRVRQLMDGTLDAGVHSYLWDGRNQAGETLRQGIYFARIHVGDSVRTSKLLMLGH
jgi:flagellar hook assembly protein FlgD